MMHPTNFVDAVTFLLAPPWGWPVDLGEMSQDWLDCHGVWCMHLADFSHTPLFPVRTVEKHQGSVGKTIEAFHRAWTASLSAKYVKTTTLKMPFHNCFPLQQKTKSRPCLKCMQISSLNSSHRDKKHVHQPKISLTVTDVNKNCESLSNNFTHDSTHQPFNKYLSLTDTEKCLGTNSGQV